MKTSIFCSTLILRFVAISLFIILFPYSHKGAYAANSATPFLLANDAKPEFLESHMEYLEDRKRILGIGDILSGRYDSAFITATHQVPDCGYTDSAYWIHFRLKNNSSRSAWLVEIQDLWMSKIEFYEIDAGRVSVHKKAGALYSFNQKDVDYYLYAFWIDIKPGQEKQFYLRLESDLFKMRLPIKIWPKELFQKWDRDIQIISGLYFGIILVMALYNLFLFIALRDRNYLYYTAFIICFGFSLMTIYGTSFEYLLPSHPEENLLLHFTMSIAAFFFSLKFTRSFLDTKKHAPLFDRVLLIITGWSCILFAYALLIYFRPFSVITLSHSKNLFILNFLTLNVSDLLILAASIRCLVRGYRPARFFVFAIFWIIIGVVVFNLMGLGIVPVNMATYYSLQLGSVSMVILLSLALADRINVLRREKEHAQAEAIRIHQVANAELQKTDRLKDEFLANTSHELRTPLSGIIGIAETLIMGATGELGEDTKMNLSMILSSGKRLFNLVNDILDMSKLKSKDLTLNRKPIDLRQAVEVVLFIIGPLVSDKNLELKNQIPHDLPLAYGDEDRLNQILYNLIGNAIKFTREGSIVISSRLVDSQTVEVSVSDTGVGIASDRIEDIFNPFVQGDASTTREFGGTGLGLSITKRLIELHGGSIRVASMPGTGSTFTFTLPLSSPGEARSERADDAITGRDRRANGVGPFDQIVPDHAASIPAGLNGQSKTFSPGRDQLIHGVKLLVVDDEPVNLQVLRNILFLAGIEVETASSAFIALEKIKGGYHPDVILLDIMMPRMNGYELCRILRQSYSISEMPIIFLTAKDRVSDLVEGLSSGANDYISKPFSQSELIARVNTQIALKKAGHDRDQLIAIHNELRIAREIQQAILPNTLPRMEGLDIQGKNILLETVGGDFFDFHLFDEKKIGIVVADVSGHGIPAAIVAAMLKVAFPLSLGDAHRPNMVLDTIQRTLMDKLGNNFLTASYVYIDIEKKTISNSRAGHPPVLIFRKSEKKFHEMNPRGSLMSKLGESSFMIAEMDIREGDRIILYTDGTIEVPDPSGNMYGVDRLKMFFERTAEKHADEACQLLVEELTTWADKNTFDDDLTVLIIDIK